MDSCWLLTFLILFVRVALGFVKKYCGGPVCRCTVRLDGKFAVVTGASSGIGLAVVEELARRGVTVIFTVRDIDRGIEIRDRIQSETKNSSIDCRLLDLNNFSSIVRFTESLGGKTIDLLVNNAATFFHPSQQTVDGFDVTFQTNYLGHFLLTELLIGQLSSSSRLIFLSSNAHRLCQTLNLEEQLELCDPNNSTTANRFLSYGRSKLCLLLYAKLLANRLKDRQISVCSVDPGSVETPIYRHFPLLTHWLLKALQAPIRHIVIKNPVQGSQTILHCALTSQPTSGGYFVDLQLAEPSPLSCDSTLALDLYERSLRWIGNLKNHEVVEEVDPAGASGIETSLLEPR